MKQSGTQTPPPKKPRETVLEAVSITASIPVIAAPAASDKHPASQASCADCAASTVPAAADPEGICKKAEGAAKESPASSFTWFHAFLLLLAAGKMTAGAGNTISVLLSELQRRRRQAEEKRLAQYQAQLQWAVEGANPERNSDREEYQKNCQRCVTAFELRMRGYNVTALPRISGRENFAMMYHPHGYIKSIYFLPDIKSAARETGIECKDCIDSQMEQWGEGSRAIVRVTWSKEVDEDQDGHTFVAVYTNGETQYIDPQTGDMDCERYFNGCEPSETRFVRTDDRELQKNANRYVRPRSQK